MAIDRFPVPAPPARDAQVSAPACAAPEPADAPGSRHTLFYGFFGAILVGLALVVDARAIDTTLIPRLLALLVVLLATLGVVASPRIGRRLQWSVLGEPIVLLWAGYLLLTCVSLSAALNVSAGFTDLFRTLATSVVLGLACLLLPIIPRWQERLVELLVLAGLCAAAVGGYEIATLLGPGLHERRAMEQITGLMSGVNLYAGILALLLPWCVCGMPILRNGWRALAGGAALALVALVVVLQSRAAWLAVLAGFVTAGYAVLLWPRTFGLSARVRLRLAAAAVSVALAAATAIAVAPEDNPLVRRFRSIFATVCATAAPADEPPPDGGRLMVWGITARMIGDHPLAGVGAGNFTVRLHEYFGDEDLDFSEIDTNWLQPHNDFLWVAAEKGLPGLVSFLGCMVAALVAAGIVLRSAASPVDRWLTLAATSALVSFLVLACFDFPLERINHQVHLAVMLAVVTTVKHRVRPAAWTQPGAAAATAVSGRFAGRRLVVLVPLAAVLSLGVAYALAALRQEREVIVARRSWREGRWDDVVAASRRGKTSWKTLDPLASPVVFLEGMARARLGDVEGAIACLEAARVQNPNRMYVINNLGILYARTGRFEDAIGCFTLAARRYPHRIEPFNNLANCLVETGRAAEAVALLEQIPEAARTDAVRANLAHARESAAGAKPPGLEPAAVPAP